MSLKLFDVSSLEEAGLTRTIAHEGSGMAGRAGGNATGFSHEPFH